MLVGAGGKVICSLGSTDNSWPARRLMSVSHDTATLELKKQTNIFQNCFS